MYWFPRAAINTVPRTVGLKQQKLVSQFWKLEGKIRVLAALLPSEGCEGDCVLCLSPNF